jgi:hypothetical protein
MADIPKIRILWIDDRERVSGYPEKTLPNGLSDWFEVIHPASSDSEVMSYASASEFMQGFKSFWFGHNLDYLPVEIIAADYNLKKRAAATRGQSKPLRELRVSDEGGESGDSKPSFPVATQRREEVDFDGLLIGAFYATLTYRHPSALVSITNYLGSMPSEVDTLRELITPFLSIATKKDALKAYGDHAVWHNLMATERSWENVISAALQPLRDRITELYKHGQIVIPPRDLSEIMNGRTNGVVRIKSPHAVRTIPLRGLFWDGKSDPQKWAEGLLESKITKEHYIRSEELAKRIWDKYNNDALMDQHAKFSRLHTENNHSEEYSEFQTRFGMHQTSRGGNTYECAHDICLDIKSAEIATDNREDEKEIRRWAALFLVRRLLKRILIFIEATGIQSITRNGEQRMQSMYPMIEEDDILLLLYPVPTSPFPLPWHIDDSKLRDNKKGGWRKWMKDNLGFVPNDVLSGIALTMGERQILQGMVMEEDIEFGQDSVARLERWKSYEPARLFLFGPDGSADQSGGEYAS